MSKLVHPKLLKELEDRIGVERRRCDVSISEYESALLKLEDFASRLDAAEIPWHTGYKSLCVSTKWGAKTRAEFSAAVEKVTQALGESPTITVEPTMYQAYWGDRDVNLFMFESEDCKVIEVEETVTRKVLKPHPACVAALSKLEEIV